MIYKNMDGLRSLHCSNTKGKFNYHALSDVDADFSSDVYNIALAINPSNIPVKTIKFKFL
jgi:hypothetical protein